METQANSTAESRYAFETSMFGLDESGFHLLRNRFNYKSYPYSAIKSLEIRRGPEIRNWLVIFILGIGLTGFAIYTILGIWNFFNTPSSRNITITQFIVPLFPLLLGVYCLIVSLKRTRVIVLLLDSGKEVLPLTDLIKVKKDREFLDYVRTNIGRLKILD